MMPGDYATPTKRHRKAKLRGRAPSRGPPQIYFLQLSSKLHHNLSYKSLKRRLHAVSDLLHLLMVQRLIQDPRCHIRNARDPAHFHPHMIRGHGLAYGTHADSIHSHSTESADFRMRSDLSSAIRRWMWKDLSKKKAEIFCTPDTGKYMETWKIH